MKSRLVEPQKLHKDLSEFFLSNYLITEIREFYTNKERSTYYGQSTDPKPKQACKKNWPICYLALEQEKTIYEPHSLCLTSQFILSNFRIGHFFSSQGGRKTENLELFSERISNQKLEEEDLLMERQRHVCECVDKDFERMKSEIRIRISKQLSNPLLMAKDKPMFTKSSSKEINSTYIEFIKKRKDINPASQEDRSDTSQSGNSKPSHEITNYNNTRKL